MEEGSPAAADVRLSGPAKLIGGYLPGLLSQPEPAVWGWQRAVPSKRPAPTSDDPVMQSAAAHSEGASEIRRKSMGAVPASWPGLCDGADRFGLIIWLRARWCPVSVPTSGDNPGALVQAPGRARRGGGIQPLQ